MEAVPSLSIRLLPPVVARSASVTCSTGCRGDRSAPAGAGSSPAPMPLARSRARCGCASIPSAEARRTSWSRVSPSRPSSPARSGSCRRGRARPGCPAEPSRAWWRWTPGGPARPRGAPARPAPPPRPGRGRSAAGPRAAPDPGRDPVRPRGDRQVPVHERHRVPGELGGGPGDLAGLPRLQPTVLDQRPEPREPVAELHRLGDQRQARNVPEVQGRGELLDRVLGHRRGPGPGQRGPVEEHRTQRRRRGHRSAGSGTRPPGARRWPGAGRPSAPPAPAAGPPPRPPPYGRPPPRPAPTRRRGPALRVRPRSLELVERGAGHGRNLDGEHRQFPAPTTAGIVLSTRGNLGCVRNGCGGFEALA